MSNSLKKLCLTALGIALFPALAVCLQVPVFENYYLCLGYVVMTVYIWSFKWYEGAIVGALGVVLYCIIGQLGFNGMPGWALGNVAIGLIIGLPLKLIKRLKSRALQMLLTAIAATIGTFVGILLIKSLIDSFSVDQPFVVRFGKNMTSFIADVFVIVISIPFCVLVDKPAQKLRYKMQG